VIEHIVNGMRFVARDGTSDTNSFLACAIHDEYGLRGYVLDRRLMFDIGAHVGGVSILAASLGARVVAVEPVPENADIIRQNVALNGYEDAITVLEGAVGTSTVAYGWTGEGLWGELTGAVHAFVGNTGHGLAREGYIPEHKITVEEFTLTGLTNEYGVPNLLKIDCEGGEWAVLAEPVISSVPVILGEYHPWSGSSVDAEVEFTDNHERLLALLDASHAVTFPDDIPSDTAGHFIALRR
jgi:FkbM family methyltransferase